MTKHADFLRPSLLSKLDTVWRHNREINCNRRTALCLWNCRGQTGGEQHYMLICGAELDRGTGGTGGTGGTNTLISPAHAAHSSSQTHTHLPSTYCSQLTTNTNSYLQHMLLTAHHKHTHLPSTCCSQLTTNTHSSPQHILLTAHLLSLNSPIINTVHGHGFYQNYTNRQENAAIRTDLLLHPLVKKSFHCTSCYVT